MTDEAESDEERDAIAEAIDRLRTETEPIAPDDFFTSLDDTDAQAFAYFVIEIIALEATLHQIIEQQGGRSEKELERATLGAQVGWVEPLLAHHPERDKLVGHLRELYRLRNAVVHELPAMHVLNETVTWSFSFVRPVTNEDGQTTDQEVEQQTDDLHVYGTMAWVTRKKLAPLVE